MWKIGSSNQTENLFDDLNALFDGSYLVNENDFSNLNLYLCEKNKQSTNQMFRVYYLS